MSSFDKYIGKLIGGRYEIENVVGVGGMAYVLMANDTQTGRRVAIKVLSEQYNDDRNAVKRFINESKAISMLHHENIVSVYDVSVSDEIKYIVMEYVDGVTLKDYVSNKTVLNWREAAKYTVQILNALSHAHAKGIIHRDIKPQNIMLSMDGKIKVTDFGIAKIATNESLTVTDKAIGTVNYISPEQASGSEVTTASDLYSVGVMLYEMVTGTLPFVSENPVAVATMHVSSQPESPKQKNPGIPTGLEQIILKAMSKSCQNRFLSASAMAKALSCLLDNPETVFSSRVSTEESETGENSKNTKSISKGPTQNKSHGSRSMFPIISGFTLAFVLVCIVSGIIAVNILQQRNTKEYSAIKDKNEKKLWEIIDSIFIGSTGTGTEIKIPSLIGYEYSEELEKELEKMQLKISKVKYTSDKNKPVGSIVAQSPEENSIRKLGDKDSFYELTVTVNTFADTLEMPDLSMMSYNAARAMLIDMGISRNSVVKEEKFDDSVVEGYVISTLPEKGETFDASSSETIMIYVSAGQQSNTTTAPELVGLSVEAAKRKIIEHELSIGKVTYEASAMEKGTVLRASVEKDAIVPAKLTRVDLFVSLGNLSPAEDPNYFNNSWGDYIIDENGNLIFVQQQEQEYQGNQQTEGGGYYLDENGNFVYKDEPENEDTAQSDTQNQDTTPETLPDNTQKPSQNEEVVTSDSQNSDSQNENNTSDSEVSDDNPGLSIEELQELLS